MRFLCHKTFAELIFFFCWKKTPVIVCIDVYYLTVLFFFPDFYWCIAAFLSVLLPPVDQCIVSPGKQNGELVVEKTAPLGSCSKLGKGLGNIEQNQNWDYIVLLNTLSIWINVSPWTWAELKGLFVLSSVPFGRVGVRGRGVRAKVMLPLSPRGEQKVSLLWSLYSTVLSTVISESNFPWKRLIFLDGRMQITRHVYMTIYDLRHSSVFGFFWSNAQHQHTEVLHVSFVEFISDITHLTHVIHTATSTGFLSFCFLASKGKVSGVS